MSTNKITCSFTVDRDIYNAYKSIVVKGGENVKGNLVRYVLNVINYETSNADTISAIKEVEELKKIQTKKPMHRGGTHKTVLEMFSGNGVACGLRRFSVM